MWKAGLTDYEDFAQRLLERITRHPISFEVFADDADEMRRQAQMIASWGENVYVKIPVTTTNGESMAPLVRELSEDGVKVNVTALFTTAQVELITAAVKRRRCLVHLCVRRSHRRRRRRSGADHGALRRHHGRRAASRADLGLSARDPQRRAGGSGRLSHHHDDARPARRSSSRSARTWTSSRWRRCRCSDGTRSRPGSRCSRMKRACITGGAGFIGSTLADRLGSPTGSRW